MKIIISFFVLIAMSTLCYSQNNLSLTGTTLSSQPANSNSSKLANDGKTTTAWECNATEKWLWITLPGATEIKKVKLFMAHANGKPITSFKLQTGLNTRLIDRYKTTTNTETEITVEFKKAILDDRVRLLILDQGQVQVQEFEIYGNKYVSEDATPVKEIIVNQSGYNLDKPKRFTAPLIDDNTPFQVLNTTTKEIEFEGVIKNHIGDFSAFNPLSSNEYQVTANNFASYPFRIAPFWLERVSYQNALDFMIGARHYVGTTNKIRRLSWAWRDGDFFNWALQSMVAQYLANPEVYKQLNKKVHYTPNDSFPADYKGKWGALEPYNENAPDIVKLIHWDVDVKISEQLEHEHQKAELAHFLYAYPYLKEWLPQQNFDKVYSYLKLKWTKDSVGDYSTTKYDKSPNHNLLALKTQMGTNKGELPPGHSVIPNLMLFEVAKRQGEPDADKYFKAAYQQMEWMIANLDWHDPMTTKGQRMSEHITMRSFAYFYHQYPNKAPAGLYQKIEDWAKVAISRSNNMWDFRKYTDTGDWVPAGWNETGNILGFPAAALSANSVITDPAITKQLEIITWSHFDDAFGRNPTGRHFSHDGPTEIEGVELGWYNELDGGIGLLKPVHFVFDGSPKTNHYPNHPEIGNLGWTEGWVQFNTAYNTSMAYLANTDTEIECTQSSKNKLKIRLKAPINFNENQLDNVYIELLTSNGDKLRVQLTEEGKYSKYLSTELSFKKHKIKYSGQKIRLKKGNTIQVSYGLGYFQKSATFLVE